MHTYQVNVRHKVSKESERDPRSPHRVGWLLEEGEVEDFFRRTKLSPGKEGASAAPTLFLFGAGNKRSVSKASQKEYKHEDAEDPQCVREAHAAEQTPQQQGEQDGEDAAARRDDAVDQSKALLEVVSQNDQGRLVGKGAAAGEYDSIGEVQRLDGAAGGKRRTEL